MDIEKIGIEALTASYKIHNSLGPSGKEELSKNQFGDTAMRGDYECEEAVITVLKKYSFPALIYSEEHGKIPTSDNPKMLGVLDGIDGSAWYKSEWGKGRYGTMFGLFQGLDPRYEDYLFGGIMEHATNRLFYGVKDKGAWVIDMKSGNKKSINTSNYNSLDQSTKIYIDQYWDINNETFTNKLTGFNVLEYKKSSSYHYADTSCGNADLTLECTRKGSLEIASAYALITEARGYMVDINGEPLGDKKYLEFGVDDHIPVITASSHQLALEAVKFFKK